MSGAHRGCHLKLYRYGRLDNRLLRYLEDRRLYFQSPLNFNDPYDCDLDSLTLTADQNSSGRFAAFTTSLRAVAFEASRRAEREVDRYREGEGPNERGLAQLRRSAAAFDLYHAKLLSLEAALAVAEGWSGKPGTLEDSWNAFKKVVVSSFGLVCFTASRTNMLLWSHYADGHKGLAIEYDTEERPVSGWKRYEYLPVQYADVREIDVLGEGYPDAFIRLLTTKGADWQYEQEHRLISLRGPGFQPNRMANISGIVLGARFLENMPDAIAAFWKALQGMDQRRRTVKKLHLGYCSKVRGSYALVHVPFKTLTHMGLYLGM